MKNFKEFDVEVNVEGEDYKANVSYGNEGEDIEINEILCVTNHPKESHLLQFGYNTDPFLVECIHKEADRLYQDMCADTEDRNMRRYR